MSNKPHASAHDCFVAMGWIGVSKLGQLPVLVSRKGAVRNILDLMTTNHFKTRDLMYHKAMNCLTKWSVCHGMAQTDNRPMAGYTFPSAVP
jgi:hypothetical protein